MWECGNVGMRECGSEGLRHAGGIPSLPHSRIPSFHDSLAFIKIIRRRTIERPTMAVALGYLLAAFQLFVIVVFHAQRAADVVHHVLIRRRVVAAWRLVADGVG